MTSRARCKLRNPALPHFFGRAAISSANSDMVIRGDMFVVMPCMYMRKRKGARMEPCGTPALSVNMVDILPSDTTCMVRFCNIDLII